MRACVVHVEHCSQVSSCSTMHPMFPSAGALTELVDEAQVQKELPTSKVDCQDNGSRLCFRNDGKGKARVASAKVFVFLRFKTKLQLQLIL
jgi:hypothetical protein